MSERSFSTRPPVKRNHIIGDVRSRIVSGQLKPGDKLPPRTELIKTYEASSVTIQSALDRLANEGFIQGKSGRGTFVSEHPPFLFRYGFAVSEPRPASPADWPNFWAILERVAQRLLSDGSRSLAVYTGLKDTDHPDAQALLEDLQNHRLAGLLFIGDGAVLAREEVAAAVEAVPCISIQGSVSAPVIDARLGFAGFLDKAAAHLKERGRSRLAILCVDQVQSQMMESAHKALRPMGLVCQPAHIQGVPLSDTAWASNVVQLMLQGPPDIRPDGLIIMDDNMVPNATAGVLSAGLSVPHDLDIVGHCNFPDVPQAVLPFTRLGYDLRQALADAVDRIDRLRRGEGPVEDIAVPALFAHELPMDMQHELPVSPTSPL